MDGRATNVSSGLELLGGVVAGVNLAERFDGAFGQEGWVDLVRLDSVDVHRSNIHVGETCHDPVGQKSSHSTSSQNTDRIQTSSDEVVSKFGGLTDDWRKIGSEGFGAAEEFANSCLSRDGDTSHGLFEEGFEALPIWFDDGEGRIFRNSLDIPRSANWFEETN